jgi:hypothetical protein
MPDLIVPIKYTYPVHFIRTRCRLMETAIVQADGVVVVQSATSAEAPSAFRVERACPGHTKPFEVRCYETSLWWPVGDDSGFATPVDFLRGLAEGNSHLPLHKKALDAAAHHDLLEILVSAHPRVSVNRHI